MSAISATITFSARLLSQATALRELLDIVESLTTADGAEEPFDQTNGARPARHCRQWLATSETARIM